MEASTRQLALVTGASSGIGRELAKQFATHGYDLVVAAEDDGIHAAAQELASLGGGSAEPVQVDLATPDGVEELWRRVTGVERPLAAAVLNAGVGNSGPFAETPLEDDLRVVDLNVRSTVHLAKHVARDMASRRSGRILVTSSIASAMPGPYLATYNASKSFVQSFALALRRELADAGVSVTSLEPGPTETNFFQRARMEDTKMGATDVKDDPADVARQGFEALMEGRERVEAASLARKLQAKASRFVPDSVKAELNKRLSAPGSARK